MRARRAGTPPRARRAVGIDVMPGAAVARRGWQRRYRCLPRAQPGPERSGGTRPTPRPSPFQSFVPKPRMSVPAARPLERFTLDGTLAAVAPHLPAALVPPPAWAAVRRAARALPAALTR